MSSEETRKAIADLDRERQALKEKLLLEIEGEEHVAIETAAQAVKEAAANVETSTVAIDQCKKQIEAIHEQFAADCASLLKRMSQKLANAEALLGKLEERAAAAE